LFCWLIQIPWSTQFGASKTSCIQTLGCCKTQTNFSKQLVGALDFKHEACSFGVLQSKWLNVLWQAAHSKEIKWNGLCCPTVNTTL